MLATCLPDHCFCEAIRASSIAQPVDAWSSLAFVLVGLWVFPKSRAFGIVLLLAGATSFYFHASLSFTGQWLDNVGMYAVALFLIFYARRSIAGFIMSLGGASLLAYLVPDSRRYLLAIFILALIVISKKASTLWYSAVGIFSLGFILWILDITRIWCSPYSLFQGHALWHVAGAVSAVMIFRANENAPLSSLQLRKD